MRTFYVLHFMLLPALAGAYSGTQKTLLKPRVPIFNLLTGHAALGGISGYVAAMHGLEYEHFITHPQWLSLTLKGSWYIGGTINLGGELEKGEVFSKTTGQFIAPGMRFHPFKNSTAADPGLGIFFPLGLTKRRDNAPGGLPDDGATRSGMFGAVAGELSVVFRARGRKSVVGFFGNIGYIYAQPEAVQYSYTGSPYLSAHSESDPLFVQLGLRFGGGW